jgi:hypothetical protein
LVRAFLGGRAGPVQRELRAQLGRGGGSGGRSSSASSGGPGIA